MKPVEQTLESVDMRPGEAGASRWPEARNPLFYGENPRDSQSYPHGPVDARLCAQRDVIHPSSMTDPMPLVECIDEVRAQLEAQREKREG